MHVLYVLSLLIQRIGNKVSITPPPGGGLHTQMRGCPSEILKRTPVSDTKILFCGRVLKYFLPPKETNSKTIHYLLSYFCSAQHLKRYHESSRCGPLRVNTLRDTKPLFRPPTGMTVIFVSAQHLERSRKSSRFGLFEPAHPKRNQNGMTSTPSFLFGSPPFSEHNISYTLSGFYAGCKRCHL